MNPDKLFDYLDGKLSSDERAALEERFMSEPELRQELAVARQIHSQMRQPDSPREIVGVSDPAANPRGAILAQRVGIAFAILVFINVLFGIYAIGFMGKKRNARPSVEENRSEFAQNLARTAAVALPTPTLDVEEFKFTAPLDQQNELANKILDQAKALGGSGTKGLADANGILIFIEISGTHLEELRSAMRKLGGSEPPPPPASPGNTILQARIVSPQ